MNEAIRPNEQLKLSEAWERAAREAQLWDAWLDLNARVAEAEARRPPLPSRKEELIQLFGDDWKEKRRVYEEERDAVIGPLTNRRANIREEINDVLREHMISLRWRATGRPDDPVSDAFEIDAESWRYFDLGAVRENCVIYPRFFRRNETRKFIYQVTVTLALEVDRPGAETGDQSSIRRLVLAIEQQLIPQAQVFNRQADLIREINRHLALSLQLSAKQLNLTGELKSLSEDNRLQLLRHFLRTVLPELGPELLDKMAMEILEKKLLGDSLDRFSTKTLQEIAQETLRHRIGVASVAG
jgi:hypothetical protein